MGDNSQKTDKPLYSSKEVLLALQQARAKLEAVERSKTEPIAIDRHGVQISGRRERPGRLLAAAA